jgi:hypothetical protein
MRSSILESVTVMEFQTTEAYSGRGLTNAAYNKNKLSNEEKLMVIERDAFREKEVNMIVKI